MARLTTDAMSNRDISMAKAYVRRVIEDLGRTQESATENAAILRTLAEAYYALAELQNL
jgi:hypothetical protein